jgi:hypothetical protein
LKPLWKRSVLIISQCEEKKSAFISLHLFVFLIIWGIFHLIASVFNSTSWNFIGNTQIHIIYGLFSYLVLHCLTLVIVLHLICAWPSFSKEYFFVVAMGIFSIVSWFPYILSKLKGYIQSSQVKKKIIISLADLFDYLIKMIYLIHTLLIIFKNNKDFKLEQRFFQDFHQ